MRPALSKSGLKLAKDKASLVYNDYLTLTGIPAAAHEYRLGNRSALEWVIDQYRVERDERGEITSDPNQADDEEYVLRLVGQVVAVSVETMKLVKALPPLEPPAAGYTQQDVTAFANVLTGWSIRYVEEPVGYMFRPNTHQPGGQVVLGQRCAAGESGGVAMLGWLARHPATLRHLATKLVRHFVADAPAEADVARVAQVLRETDGDLKAAALAVVDLPGAWVPLRKLRTPMDYVAAVLRALDLPADKRPDLRGVLGGMGQPYMSAPLPNGWGDTAADWAAPEAVLRRIDWAYGVTGKVAGTVDAAILADRTLGGLLPAEAADSIRRAADRRTALTLLLTGPEFQRR